MNSQMNKEQKADATTAVMERTALSTTCRFCGKAIDHVFVDLGMSPLCESFLSAEQLNGMEPFYPLRVYVCQSCLLVQLSEYVSPHDIFTEDQVLLFVLRQLGRARSKIHRDRATAF